jgi:tRNA (cytidine/uridine-2'-O-)-methyltransferase
MSDQVVRPARRSDFFSNPPLQIVLVEPEIPPNTGNIARMCYATGSQLHLIEPLGFEIDDRYLRRAGLDYWEHIDVKIHPNIDALIGPIIPRDRCFFFSTRATQPFWDIPIQPGDALFFGKESVGLGPKLLELYRDRLYHIPVLPNTVRSLNISNSAAIAIYDCYRRIASIP